MKTLITLLILLSSFVGLAQEQDKINDSISRIKMTNGVEQ